MIDKVIEIGILFDFYGKLLSPRQYNVVESFYILDLSLSEIGEDLGISRQSVYDTLKRSETNLFKFENRLGLLKKFRDKNDDIAEIINLSNDIEKRIQISQKSEDRDILELINKIKKIGLRILKNS